MSFDFKFLTPLAEKASRSYDDGRVQVGDELPRPRTGQQGDGLETIRFAVTVHPSIGRVCARHLNCNVVGICDDIFITACLSKALSWKKILKADLDMDLNVPKFSVFFPDTSFSLDTARSSHERGS